MNQAYFRFYAELNDFLPLKKKKILFAHCFKESASLKDLIEAIGVPHPEIDLILANGEAVDFSYLLREGDRFSVYPIFKSLDLTPLLRVGPQPLQVIRFVLDVHLGKLAKYLRLLGFDTLYHQDYGDRDLASLSCGEERNLLTRDRNLLTRDRNLLKRSIVTDGYYVRPTKSWQQLKEVLRRFDLLGEIHPFQRCLRCNSCLKPVNKDPIEAHLPAKTRQYYNEFRFCLSCERADWKGSHYKRRQHFIQQVQNNI